MSSSVALGFYVVLIFSLFYLDHGKSKTSLWLWLPVIWMALACSRSVGQWLEIGKPIESSEQIADGSPLDRVIYTVLFLIGCAILVSRSRRVKVILSRNISILLFFGFCLFSLLWSDFADIAFKRWVKALGDFVMVLIVLSEKDVESALQTLLARLAYILVPLSVLFIKYFPEIGKGYGKWDGQSLYIGDATNKNTLGAICLFLGLATLWRFIGAYKEKDSRLLVASGIILVMVGWLFNMANSMTGLSCFAFGCVILFASYMGVFKKRPAALHLLIAGVIAFAISVLFLGANPELLSMIGRNPTLTDRTEIWSIVLPLQPDALLGAGFESFWLGPRLNKIWGVYSWHPEEAHKGYIEIFLNLGWVGVLLLGVVLWRGYKKAIAAYRRNAPAANLMLSFFIVGLVYNFTEAAFFRMMTPAWVFLLFSLTKQPIQEQSKKAHQFPGGLRSEKQAEHAMTVNWGETPSERIRDGAHRRAS